MNCVANQKATASINGHEGSSGRIEGLLADLSPNTLRAPLPNKAHINLLPNELLEKEFSTLKQEDMWRKTKGLTFRFWYDHEIVNGKTAMSLFSI